MRSLRSSSSTWDQLVEAVVTADPKERDSGILEEDFEDLEPAVERDIADEPIRPMSSHPAFQHVAAEGSGHRAKASVDATTDPKSNSEQGSVKRESVLDSLATTARASTVDETPNFRFSLKLSDDLDVTLKDPQVDNDGDKNKLDMTQEEDNETTVSRSKETRISRPGSHSGSSTMNEPLEDITEDLSVPSAPFSAFPTRAKRIIVVSAASASVFAPLSMQIYLPSLTTLVTDFGVSRTKINLTLSVYMVFMALAPMFMGGIADVIGRRPAMLFCFSLYVVSCVLIALCHTYTELMGFRILQSVGASPLIAIASAVVADIVTSAERGSYAALVAVPVIFAPTLGPVIGGLLTEYLGWRSIFWFLLAAGGFGFLMIGLFFPETCRVIVGDASAKSPKRYRSVIQTIRDPRPDYSQSAEDEKRRLKGKAGVKALLWTSLTSAVRVLCTKERFFLLFYVGLIFSGFQAIATELPTQFRAIYGYDSVMIGVMYLPLAGGAILSTAVFGKQMNKNFRRYAARAGIAIEAGREVDMYAVAVDRARLEVTFPALLISTAGIVCWGWVLEARTSIAAPCVLLFFMGVGLNGVMATTNALLMDISQAQAGAVMAASNLTRCALGAVASAVIQLMIDKIGLGWTYVVFGIVFLLFSPMLAVQYFWGQKWRQQAKAREDAKIAAEEKAMKVDVEQGRGLVFAADSPDKQRGAMQAAAVDAVVAAPAIPLVEMAVKPEKEEDDAGRDSVGSRKGKEEV